MPPILTNFRTSAATGNLRRNSLYLIGFLIFFIYAANKLADPVISADINGLAYVALAIVVGCSTIAMLNNWRNGLYFFITWLLVEDLARKYLGNHLAIYFGKDFLVGVVLIAFFIVYRDKKVQTFRPPFRAALLLFLWFGIMQIFNPASGNILFVIFWYTFRVLVPFTFNGLNTYQNFVMNASLWLLIGVLFRLPTLKLLAQPDAVTLAARDRFGVR